MVSTMRFRFEISFNSAEPADCLTTFGTGQPQFRSMPSIPSIPFKISTAFFTMSASLPAICTIYGVSRDDFLSISSVLLPS